MTIINNFMRYEIKYMLSPEQFGLIIPEIKNRLIPDAFCKDNQTYMIYNVYLDTEDNAVIRRSIQKPYYKEKLRIRSYKLLNSPNDPAFIELKKKVGGIVTKRRTQIPYAQLESLILSEQIPSGLNYMETQVCQEIKQFLSRYPATPKVYISYERMAFFDKDDLDFRISFDRNILTRRTDPTLITNDYGSDLIPDCSILMEIKCKGALPLWLCSLLSQNHVYKTNFSKYGEEYKKFVLFNSKIA